MKPSDIALLRAAVTNGNRRMKASTRRAARPSPEPENAQRWVFEQSPPMGGASGEAFSNPLMSTGMHPAAVLAREAIQNSVDARQPDAEKVLVRFRAVSLDGQSKKKFVECAGLSDLAPRADRLGLSTPNCLKNLNSGKEGINLLFVEDFHTTGLQGDPQDPASKFYRFLLSLGDGGKVHEEHGTGGSFGFGKSVYCSNSSILTIFAYTRFREANGRVRSRLFGCGYFRSHRVESTSCTGRAWFGVDRSEGPYAQLVRPFEDEQAEELAARLHFESRGEDDLGLSVLIVDAAIDVPEILKGAEDWWWPRLIEGQLDVQVVTADGKGAVPRPRKREDLRPFIDAYDVAVGRNTQPIVGREARRPFRKYEQYELGVSAFKVLEQKHDGDLPVGEERVDSVALIRNPRMVVSYYRAWQQSNPPVVGVFVADDQVDDILRASEPPAHNRWDKESRRLRDAEGVRKSVVNVVLSRVRSQLKQFQNEASPPPPPRPRRLTILERALASFLTGEKGGRGTPPEPTSAPFHLTYEAGPEAVPAGEGSLKLRARFSVRLKNDGPLQNALMRLRVTCPVLEDGSEGESIGLSVVSDDVQLQPDPADSTVFTFSIKQDETVRVSVESELYDPLWTVRLRPEVEPVETQQ
jgi:hypothetical protein